MNVIILHGTGGYSGENWFPWMKEQLERRGYRVFVPDLPDSDFPNGEKWADYVIQNTPFEFDEEMVIVGHSAGAALIPMLLQKLAADTRVKKAILVSGFHDTLGWEKLKDLQNVVVDYDRVKQEAEEFILLHSDNDPYVDLSQAEWLAGKLGGQLRVLKGQGHFNIGSSPKYKEFPKLLSIIIKGDELQRLYLASSFRGQGVAQMIMDDVEQKTGKIAQDIKVLYVTTAGNLHPADQRTWIDEGREILKARGWQVFDYDFEGESAAEVAEAMVDKDVIFAQGGNNFYLLDKMHKCGFKDLVQKFLAKGGFYIGESAGAIVCARNLAEQRCMSSDAKVELDNYEGLGLVNFLIRPHWNRQGEKREKYFRPVQENAEEFYSIKQPTICLNDNQVIYVEGDCYQIWEGNEA